MRAERSDRFQTALCAFEVLPGLTLWAMWLFPGILPEGWGILVVPFLFAFIAGGVALSASILFLRAPVTLKAAALASNLSFPVYFLAMHSLR